MTNVSNLWQPIILPCLSTNAELKKEDLECIESYFDTMGEKINKKVGLEAGNVLLCGAEIRKIEEWMFNKQVEQDGAEAVLTKLQDCENTLNDSDGSEFLIDKMNLIEDIQNLSKTILLHTKFKENESVDTDKLSNLFLKKLTKNKNNIEIEKSNTERTKKLKNWGWKILTVVVSLLTLAVSAAIISMAVLLPLTTAAAVACIIKGVVIIPLGILAAFKNLWPNEEGEFTYLDLHEGKIKEEMDDMLQVWQKYRDFRKKIENDANYLAQFDGDNIHTLEDLYAAIEKTNSAKNPEENVA